MSLLKKKGWILVCLIGATLLYVSVAKKLYDIQIRGVASGIKNRTEFTKRLPARRGGIYDRNGREHPLAVSAPCWRVFVDPEPIPANGHAEVIRELCQFSVFDADRVYTAVTRTSGRYHPIGETADRDIVNTIATNTVLRRCVGTNPITRRYYPMDRHMCHIVGAVNSHDEPLMGIEKTMDRYLTGTDGSIKGTASAKRREIAAKREEKIDPIHGDDVFLTLDRNIQYLVENALDETMLKTQAQAGWIIVQNPKTGEILAMASRPNFSPDTFGSSLPTDQWNRAIFSVFEPGSTMKAVPFAAAVNEHLYTTNSLINVDNVLYAGRPLNDHVRGDITLTVALQKSSNRASSRIAMGLGRETMEAYFRAFGFGSRTGIDLEGEGTGTLHPARALSEIGAIRIAIGQGVAVTGIQMVSLYSTIANNGIRMKPYVIQRVVAADGTVRLENTPTPLSRPITPATAADTTFMLTHVTQKGGTGRRAAIPGYQVAGKTGTAQIPIAGGYSHTDYVGSFVGFFPADDPQVTILVCLEAPKPLYQGGTVAAPVFSELGAKIARYLEIPPDTPVPIIY